LRRFCLPIVLAGHSLEAYRNKALWGRLLELQADGVVHKLGVSCCNPSDTLEALADPAIEHIQIAFNILDWRWRDGRVQQRLQRRPDVTIHARSIFLQGLLLSPAQIYPEVAGVDATLIVGTLESLAAKLGCANRKQLVLAYCRSERHRWIHSFLWGIVTVAQLQENLADLEARAPLSEDECRSVDAEVGCLEEAGCLPEELLNPHLWPKRNVISPVPADYTEKQREVAASPPEMRRPEASASCKCLAQSNTLTCICGSPKEALAKCSLAALVADAELDAYQVCSACNAPTHS